MAPRYIGAGLHKRFKLKKKYVIAIDGPAGVGKTTTAKLVAKKLGYIYIDTGAMYRAVAWKSLKERTGLSDSRKLKSMLAKLDMRIISENARMKILIDGEDITGRLRTRTITELSSKISAIREVRQYLAKIQRKAGRKGGVVIEGRDIGTVVFPETPYKFFLDASIQERARRRYLELKKGVSVTIASIKQEIMARDKRDITRAVSPLRKADDAIVIDSTKKTAKGVVECIVNKIKQSTE